jgi:hypothetical protein
VLAQGTKSDGAGLKIYKTQARFYDGITFRGWIGKKEELFSFQVKKGTGCEKNSVCT